MDQDPGARFDERASYYARHRPDYPDAALDAILEDLLREVVAADIGAGTGISARQLTARGASVFAVEPNVAMAAAAEPDPRVEWIEGTAERTGLDDGSCDLVLCAQSYHWFDSKTALVEFRRILRPKGRLALLWNIRDSADDFQIAFTRVLDGLDRPVSQDRSYIEGIVLDGALFENVRGAEFRHEQRLTGEGLVGRTMSLSYFPHHGPEHDRRMAQVRALHESRRDDEGIVPFRYRSLLWLAEPTA